MGREESYCTVRTSFAFPIEPPSDLKQGLLIHSLINLVQARYIPHLKKRADKRQLEADIIFERRLLRERKKEDYLYASKEKYVTSAYKEKLKERMNFERELVSEEKRDKDDDVRKKKDIGGFYQNIFSDRYVCLCDWGCTFFLEPYAVRHTRSKT